jgi:hypothetical protein
MSTVSQTLPTPTSPIRGNAAMRSFVAEYGSDFGRSDEPLPLAGAPEHERETLQCLDGEITAVVTVNGRIYCPCGEGPVAFGALS